MDKEQNIMESAKFWAKTTKDGQPGKSVLSHMQDVKAVANILLTGKESILSTFNLDKKAISNFAGLHDIGKISPGFQLKCPAWLRRNNLEEEAKNYAWKTIYESDHSKVTQYTIQNLLQKNNMQTEAAELWGTLIGAHHGRIHKLYPKDDKKYKKWETYREKTVNNFLGSDKLPDLEIDNSCPLLWWLAGLISVADWIGSNEDWFPAEKETTLEKSNASALSALRSIGFNQQKFKEGLSFKNIFKFSPNNLQKKAGESISEPGVYVIEAPMGMGKTEAALWCAYKLMCEGKASGIYFALPTQMTSNRIHKRVQKFLTQISDSSIDVRLIHASSWLLQNITFPHLRATTADENESVQDAKDWFASKKRALLAPCGVGTVDQALMSVIAVKHFFVRQFALAGKIVILDEVHSYDLYTGTLIETLCNRLLPLGCTVIVLSATLTDKVKKQFIKSKNNVVYPLIEGIKTGNNKIVHVPIIKPKDKRVLIVFKDEDDAVISAIEKAKNGAKVLWVCDTVECAQKMYERTTKTAQDKIELGLLHARFPIFRREELENYWLEKFSKKDRDKRGCILFGTQVVEQSVDLDADFMISELAPTDMLLQRMGRLWRHSRKDRPCRSPEFCIVAENNTIKEFKKAHASEIKKMLGSKAFVYASYVLLRTYELWQSLKTISIPSDIRDLLKRTYEEHSKEPAGWLKLKEEIEGEVIALKDFAECEANIWNGLLDDEEDTAKTRINNLPQIQLILAKQKQGKKMTLLNGDIAELGNEADWLSAARAIHRNIVKVPEYCFEAKADNKDISTIVRGKWQLGFVCDDGNVKNIKSEYILSYSPEKGIEKQKKRGGI